MSKPRKDTIGSEALFCRALAMRLRNARISAGYHGCAEFARLIGVTPQQLYKYETGENRPSVYRLILIASVLDTPIETLIGPAETIPRPLPVSFATLSAHYQKLSGERQELVRRLAAALARDESGLAEAAE